MVSYVIHGLVFEILVTRKKYDRSVNRIVFLLKRRGEKRHEKELRIRNVRYDRCDRGVMIMSFHLAIKFAADGLITYT